MADFEFVEGSRRPFFAVTVKSVLTNAAVSLSGASAVFYLREQKSDDTPKVNGVACVITDAAAGELEYRWAASDLDTPGIYDAIFDITFSDSLKQAILIKGVVVHPNLSP